MMPSVKARCPECGSKNVCYEWRAYVRQTRVRFKGSVVSYDPFTVDDVEADDGVGWFVCDDCLYEDSEPRSFQPKESK